MRIIVDFDGVFTEHTAEAEAVGARHLALVSEALGDAARAQALVLEMRAEARKDPERSGWLSGGAISCYADEDPYAFHNAVAAALYARAPADVIERLGAAGMPTHEIFASRAFDEGTAIFRSEKREGAVHVLPEALAATAELCAAGVDVVIVSNSSTERIRGLLRDAGIGRFGQAKPRIRGGAEKFRLGDEPRALAESQRFGAREIRLRRPSYFSILRDEMPDLVVGDVLSLDLAMPLAARSILPELDEMVLALVRHPATTPAWTLDACRARGIEVIDSLARVPKLLAI
jgi:FMN phosphatase YigB (HAD superfamily)